MEQSKVSTIATSAGAAAIGADVVHPGAAGGTTSVLGRNLPKQRSLWSDAFRRLRRNKLAIIGLVIVILFAFIALFAPLLAPYGQAEVVDPRLARYGPSWTWPMGLDQNGRDIFSRLCYGARVSLTVGLVAETIILAIGVTIGALAGYFAGMTDTLLMRLVDVVYAVPQILLVMIFLNLFGPGLQNIFIAIGVVGWVTEGRLTRGQFLSLRESEFVSAARVSGAGPTRIILRHMLPNAMTPLIVAATFGVPTAIFTEASLSYVGVGVMPPQASWGQMVGDASVSGYIQSAPHMLVFPVLAIGLTMLGFTFLGDGLRDALDVRGDR